MGKLKLSKSFVQLPPTGTQAQAHRVGPGPGWLAGWLGCALNGADTQFPATEKAVPNPFPLLFHPDILELGHGVS